MYPRAHICWIYSVLKNRDGGCGYWKGEQGLTKVEVDRTLKTPRVQEEGALAISQKSFWWAMMAETIRKGSEENILCWSLKCRCSPSLLTNLYSCHCSHKWNIKYVLNYCQDKLKQSFLQKLPNHDNWLHIMNTWNYQFHMLVSYHLKSLMTLVINNTSNWRDPMKDIVF